MEAVDKLVADTEATLAAHHLTDKTYFVFSSDNGYHLGQHRLNRGKQTAFDTDIHVPLIVAGPGVPHGRTVAQVAQNVDLYPTFVQLAGATPGHADRGPQPGAAPAPVEVRAAVAHRRAGRAPEGNDDPPTPTSKAGAATRRPTRRSGSRRSICPASPDRSTRSTSSTRTPKHETEYYDIKKDPYERRNIASRLTAAQRSELHKILVRLEHCHTATTCWTAASPS